MERKCRSSRSYGAHCQSAVLRNTYRFCRICTALPSSIPLIRTATESCWVALDLLNDELPTFDLHAFCRNRMSSQRQFSTSQWLSAHVAAAMTFSAPRTASRLQTAAKGETGSTAISKESRC